MAFTFDEATHGYALDGIPVPSVTRTLDHAGLVSYDMVREEILERTSRVGVLVHQATHFLDEQDLDFSSLHDDIRGRVEAWANFKADTGFVPRLIEKRFLARINGMTVGLTIDREGIFRKEEAIIELKTSAVAQDWWAIQTAGYALGVPGDDPKASAMSLFLRRRRLAVQLFSDGSYKKFDYEDRNDAGVFMSALHIAHWKMSKGKKLRTIEE